VIARRPRKQFVDNIAAEVKQLGIRASDDALLRGIASEIAALAPVAGLAMVSSAFTETPENPTQAQTVISGNGHTAAAEPTETSPGRLPKVEGIDYKRGALEYTDLLSEELSYYLRTKPFCNLHKPVKFKGDGMDPETHRHFSDFANMAVALALPANARILDVGCGPGWLSEYFARLGYDVTGIDLSDDLIQIARERLERVPYQVDHETPLRCRFLTHDIEVQPLAEKFDAVICYDSLHHLEDEQRVFNHLAAMLNIGGLLFILEGRKPSAGSATEDELRGFMLQYKTLESPFSDEYLRSLLCHNSFAIVGDYVSVNGLFEREMLEDNSAGLRLPLRTLDTDYHYLTCMKVAQDAPATSVPDSRAPGVLRAELTLRASVPQPVEPGTQVEIPITISNTGDTLWLTGQTVRAGVVMPGVRIFDEHEIVSEYHGQPLLPRPVAPGQTVALNIQFAAPAKSGTYAVKIDLVDQCVCWFEERGSEPLVFSLEVDDKR
jgi:2-polyprenyl-3-methyl-5-hydroxy-6-metoxy-1,4-benzoquinol methylase